MNKKGFTLVELLAVIVILALIMGIAVVSIGGVLDSAKKNTFKETAASIIDGVKKELLVKNKLEAGTYVFTKGILDKGGSESPMGGTLTIGTTCSGTAIGSNICKVADMTADDCTADASSSFIVFDANRTGTICLVAGAGNPYIWGSEAELLSDSSDIDVIKGD